MILIFRLFGRSRPTDYAWEPTHDSSDPLADLFIFAFRIFSLEEILITSRDARDFYLRFVEIPHFSLVTTEKTTTTTRNVVLIRGVALREFLG